MSPEKGQKSFLGLAVPNIITNLTVPMAGLVDMALLGHLESLAPLAGVALGGLIFDYLYWSFGFLRMGTTGIAAQTFGAGDDKGSAAVFGRSLLLALGIAALILVFRNLVADQAFFLLQGEPEVEAEGRAYYFARVWGAPATLCGYVIVGWLLGRHHVRSVLIYTFVMNGLNIFLDWYFIYKLDMGAQGAGMATMWAEYTALLVALFLVFGRWRGLPPIWKADLFQKNKFWELLRLQGHILLRTFCLLTTFGLFTAISSAYGAVVLAGNTLLLRFLNTAAFFIDGFSHALESLAGTYWGGRRYGRLKAVLKTALRWNMMTVGGFLLLFIIGGEQLFGVFTNHQEVIDYAGEHLPFLCLALVFSGFAYILDGYFVGLALGSQLSKAMGISTFFGFLPFVLTGYLVDDPVWLWIGMVVFMAARTATLGWKASKPLEVINDEA